MQSSKSKILAAFLAAALTIGTSSALAFADNGRGEGHGRNVQNHGAIVSAVAHATIQGHAVGPYSVSGTANGGEDASQGDDGGPVIAQPVPAPNQGLIAELETLIQNLQNEINAILARLGGTPVTSTADVPTVNGVSGPMTLTAGTAGTWTIQASDPQGENLTYSVNWGDTANAPMAATAPAFQQTATFTHVYETAGDYTPTFTVENTSGETAQTSLSVQVTNGTTTPATSTAPVISNVATTNIATSSAQISWITDQPAWSDVYYSTSTPVVTSTALEASTSTLSTSHALSLTGLAAGTTYYFLVESENASGTSATANGFSFTTAPATLPLISSIMVPSITSSTAEISWQTNVTTTGKILYSATLPLNLGTASSSVDNTLATSHSLTLGGLTASTTYEFAIEAGDQFGNTATSTPIMFTTPNH